MSHLHHQLRITGWSIAVLLTTLAMGCQGSRAPILGGQAGITVTPLDPPIVTPPPQVSLTVPGTTVAGPTLNVTTNTAITAAFTEAMDPATLTSTTFTVTGPAAAAVPGVVTYASYNAIFKPSAALAANTTYTATITSGAKDLFGNRLAGNQGVHPAPSNYVWTFTTGLAPDTILPRVTLTNPSTTLPGPTTGAAINAAVSAAFTEPMNPASLTAASFTLAGPGGTTILGTVSYASETAVFLPAVALASNTTYTATVTTAATDLAGNALAGNLAPLPNSSNYVWTFTTNPAPDLTRPRVTLTVPATTIPGPTTGVAINAAVSAAFTEPMNPATLTVASFTLTGPNATPVNGTVAYASGTAIFTPATVLTSRTVYTATLTQAARDLAGNALAGNQGSLPASSNYVWTFTTGLGPDSSLPRVTLTSPSTTLSGPTPGAAINAAVSAAFTEPMNPATLTVASFTLAGPGGTPILGAVSYASETVVFIPAVALASNTTYTATVTTAATDLAGNALAGNQAPLPAFSNYVWTFTTNPAPNLSRPRVNLTVPATTIPGPTTGVAINTAVSAAFTEPMNPATLNVASFTLTGPSATPVNGTVTYASGTAIFTPATVLASSTVYTATLTQAATDLAGNALAGNQGVLPAPSSYVWTFITGLAPDTILPRVTLTNPSTTLPGPTTGAAINAAVSAAFTEPMNPASLTAASFTLAGPGGAPILGAVSYASETAVFIPSVALASSTTYTATVTTAATDLAGNALAGNQVALPASSNYVWTFTTKPPPDLTRSRVTLTVPATTIPGPTTGVAINAAISAAFTEPMNPATLNVASFTLTGPSATPVNGTVTYASGTAIFTPATVLASNTVYTATLTQAATDLAGNALAGNQGVLPAPSNYVWTFITGLGPDTSLPRVTLTNPSTTLPGPTTGAAINAAVSAAFTEPMNPASLTAASFTLAGPGGTPILGAVSYASETAVFIPAVALASNTTYTATVTTAATDLAGNTLAGNQAPMPASSSYVWTFTTNPAPDLTRPRVTLTVPATTIPGPTTSVAINAAISAAFTEPMNPATLNVTSFTLTGPSATPVNGTVTYASGTAIFTPAAVLASSTVYTATLTQAATDLAGNALAGNQGILPEPSSYVWTFTTSPTPDLARPMVTLTVPATTLPGPTTGVALNSSVSAAFTKPMNPGTLTVTSFTLTGPGLTVVPGNVAYASGIAVFTPTGLLVAGTTYTATITTTATDLAGNALAGNQAPLPAASNYVWTFRTSAAVIITKPMVALTTPLTTIPGPTLDVPTNTIITAAFTKPMNPATLNAASFTVTTPLPGVNPAGSVSYAASSQTAIFTPVAPMMANTTYTATITTAATDLTGNQLAGNQAPLPAASDYVWTFSTAALIVTPPAITLTVPANADMGLTLNASVGATFSKAMNPLTLTTATFTVQTNSSPLGSPLAGAVTYDSAAFIATFTPAANLLPNTTYLATINGAKDLTGNDLVYGPAANPWTFTTGTTGLAPGAVNLGSASTFGIMATTAITNTGLSVINGDVSLEPGTSMTGFPPGVVNGTIHINDAVSAQARVDLLNAYNWATALPPGTTITAGADLGAAYPLGLAPGTYTTGSTLLVSTPLTLDAGGNVNAVWVFQIGSSFTTSASVTLANGAQAKNVFWVPVLDGTVGIGTTFYGTIISGRSVTAATGATINGRILAGATTAGTTALQATTVNVPAP